MPNEHKPNFAAVETAAYAGWEKNGKFTADATSNKTPYTIMMPPPNVTGSLHVGHALTNTLQDILIRWRRMMGDDALWMPGTDHAGIATQMVVERLLASEGISRKEMGREKFLDRVWQWKAESGGNIVHQLRRLGASPDWSRERFTMDEGLSKAVREAFVSLHEKGLIYRARRLVNWDPKFQSAISDLEVESKEVKGSLWHINYPIDGMPGRTITVATTRPETLLGDVAVAVHPTDERYQDLIGKHAILPLVGRLIPIVADEHSDPEKGTGAVKITPAHDFNDFNVGQRHNLPMPSVLDLEARIMLDEIAGEIRAVDGIADPAYLATLAGKDRFEARKLIIAKLEELGLFEKAEPHTSQIPHAERGGTVVEPRLTTQWFCNAEELAKPAIEAVKDGRMEFVPRQWENTYFAWMSDLQPWCISRQLWWGHRIPAWYGPDGHVFVARDEQGAQVQAKAHYGSETALVQDEDVLDTWFSSALWPFSTLGWPEKTPELARYYPGDVLVTGFDIIFFWVSRMMMMGMHFMGDVPFRKIYMHGLVRDERGQKMSKTKGNVIDPLTLVDDYGADALRWSIAVLAGPGRNINLGPARVETSRNFITKLRNASVFCERNGITANASFDPSSATLPLTRWILDETNRVIEETTKQLTDFRFDEYAAALYHFVWNNFCDWFIELAKPALNGPQAEEVKATAGYVLGIILRLLQPVAPFVTEEIYTRFGYGEAGSLIAAEWPQTFTVNNAAEAQAELGWLIRFVSAIRAVRSEMNVPHTALLQILLHEAAPATLKMSADWRETIMRLTRSSGVEVLDGAIPADVAQVVVDEATVIMPLAGVIDLAAERERLKKDIVKAQEKAARMEAQLANQDFIARAPSEVVEESRKNLAAVQDEVAKLSAALKRI